MNIITLMGGKILWLGDNLSLAALNQSLMPDQVRMAFELATIERQAQDKEREQRGQIRVARAEAMLAGAQKGVKLLADPDDDDDDDDDLYDSRDSSVSYRVTDNGVAVLGIQGLLVNSDAWYLKYMGKVGYPHIISAAIRAARDPKVKSVLLKINCPGGAALGIEEASDALKMLNSLKPVTTFASGQMSSGGYWLGSCGSHITVSPLTSVGSIGVVMTHTDQSKMLEKMGLDVTVLRHGEYKMLATPSEPLSEKAEAEMRASMAYLYEQFTGHVATQRGVSASVVDSQMGQGREFWGAHAKDVGLVDEVGNIASAIAHSRSLVQTSPATLY